MNQKGFALLILLIGLVLIVGIIGGVYYLKHDIFNKLSNNSPKACSQIAKLCPDGSSVGRSGPNCEFSPCPSITQTQDETTSWKVYINEKMGYSIKYPPDWKVIENTAITDDTKIEPLKNASFKTKWDGNVFDMPVDISITINTNSSACSYEPKEIIIDGIRGYIGKETVGDGIPHEICATVKKKDTSYFLQLTDKDYLKEQLFNQILSTFKFLDQNQTTDTSNWKTYTDNKYFSLKYPQDWIVNENFNSKDKAPIGGIAVYNPNNMTKLGFGQGYKSWPSEYIIIWDSWKITSSAENPKSIVDSVEKNWQDKVNKEVFQRESFTENGIQYEYFYEPGEGSIGRNIYISDGKIIVGLNYSGKNSKEKTIENQILSTFKITQ